jgi:hypothetical protein
MAIDTGQAPIRGPVQDTHDGQDSFAPSCFEVAANGGQATTISHRRPNERSAICASTASGLAAC